MKILLLKTFSIIKKNKNILYLILILIASIYPRTWMLTRKPPIVVDEPANLRSLKPFIETGKFMPLEIYWDFSKPMLSFYPTYILIQTLGSDNELLALRLTSVLYSILALIPFFLLVKKYTNPEISLAVTLLFSSSYYFLQFSRVGWVDGGYILTLGLYLLYFLQKALDSLKDKGVYLLFVSGVCAGLIFYGYRAGFIFIAAAFILLSVSLIRTKFNIKRKIVFFTIFLSAFFLTVLLWLLKIPDNWERFNLRANVVSIKNISLPYHGASDINEVYKYQIITSIKSWVFLTGVDSGSHESPRYLPQNKPPFNFLIRLSFWAGLLVTLTSAKYFKKGVLWVLIIILSIIFGQVLTVDPPNGARALAGLPSYYIISSLAFYKLFEISRRKKLITIGLLIISIIFAFHDFYFYKDWMEWIKV